MKRFVSSLLKSILVAGILLSTQLGNAQEYQSSIGLRLGTYSALSFTNNDSVFILVPIDDDSRE